jgi:restriction system protein
MQESYEELMLPLFLKLGGNNEELHMDEFVARKQESANAHSATAEETSNILATAHRASTRALEEQVLAHIYAQSPRFFECLIIDLLLAMGYANRKRDLARHIGCSHDGGVDGIISQDPLGLDVILLQAKRLKPNSTISSSQVRDFIGTLETKKATKGIFVTTGEFSAFARAAIQSVSHRVRLISGRELSALMVRHSLGVKPTQSFVFKTLDHTYFAVPCRDASIKTSVSSQPLK